MKKFSTHILFLFAVLAFLALAGCTGNNGVTPPAPSATTVPISKYTITGVAPGASIAASPGNPFTTQVSVASFGATTKVDFITLTKSTNTSNPTWTETISTSSTAAYPALQAPPMPLMATAGGTLPNDPLAATAVFRQSESQLRGSWTKPQSGSIAINALGNATPITVGTVNSFWVNADLSSTLAGDVSVNATCRYVGTNVYIYVDNTIVDATLTASPSATLTAIANAFDTTIYPTDTATFGSEYKPGIDGDNRVTILISPAVNGHIPAHTPTGVLGYFWGRDEVAKTANGTITDHSNQREMFYVVYDYQTAPPAWTALWADAAASGPNSKTGYGVLAHEFQHMINFYQKTIRQGISEDTWLNEGLSMYAMQACGYGMPNGDTTSTGWVQAYLNAPHAYSLTNWIGNGYGIDYLFVLYLVEHYPSGTLGVGSAQSQAMLQAMESNSSVGIANVETQTGGAGTFGAVFKNWAMANLLDHVTTNAAYNYKSIDLNGANSPSGPTLTGITPIITNTAYPLNIAGYQLGWSTMYQRHTNGANNALNINIMSTTSVNNLEGVVVVQ